MNDDLIKKIGDIVDQKMSAALEPINEGLKEIKDTQNNQILPSVLNTETTLKGYGDMYKINDDNARKLEKRVQTLEDKTGVTPPSELTLVEVQ